MTIKSLLLFSVVFFGASTVRAETPQRKLAQNATRPERFPVTTKMIDELTIKNFAVGKSSYCKNFGEGLLSKASETLKKNPSYMTQKQLSEKFCKLNTDGSYEFIGISEDSDDANNRFIDDRLSYDRLVKGICQLRKFAPNGSDRIVTKGACETLSGYVDTTKLFSALEYDSNGVPTKGLGLLVDLYSAQMTHKEIAVRLGQLQTWINAQFEI